MPRGPAKSFPLSQDHLLWSARAKVGSNLRRSQLLPETPAEEPAQESEEVEWEPEVEGTEVLDDPVRMYLREIGRVHLLTSKDERVLARKMEGERHVEKLEKEMQEANGRPPRAWEVCYTLLQRLDEAAPLVSSLGENLGLSRNLTLSQITDHPKLRAAIDAELNQELMANIAEDIEMEQTDVERKVIQLSLGSWVLPTDVIDVLEDCTLEHLMKTVGTSECYLRLRSMDMLFHAYFERIRQEGLRAQGHLTEANLRLVVSVAKKYNRQGHGLARPDPGGKHRPHQGGREVRLPERIQVQHLRHLVDTAGHHPRHRRPGPHNTHTGAHG